LHGDPPPHSDTAAGGRGPHGGLPIGADVPDGAPERTSTRLPDTPPQEYRLQLGGAGVRSWEKPLTSQGSQGLRGSPAWTRTKNLSVNSRLLCQLSYRGSSRFARARQPLKTSKLREVRMSPRGRGEGLDVR